MSRSIHDNRKTYWREARFDYASASTRAERLGGILRRLWRKKVLRFNARREHQAARADEPAFVSVSPEEGSEQSTIRHLRSFRTISEPPPGPIRSA